MSLSPTTYYAWYVSLVLAWISGFLMGRWL